MNIKNHQILSKIVKTWRTIYDFLTLENRRVDFYRWLSRKLYGKETRVIKTRYEDLLIINCRNCPGHHRVETGKTTHKLYCAIRMSYRNSHKKIDPACELHFRTPIIFSVLGVFAIWLAIAIIVTAICFLWVTM